MLVQGELGGMDWARELGGVMVLVRGRRVEGEGGVKVGREIFPSYTSVKAVRRFSASFYNSTLSAPLLERTKVDASFRRIEKRELARAAYLSLGAKEGFSRDHPFPRENPSIL